MPLPTKINEGALILAKQRKPTLTVELLQSEAASFAVAESAHAEPLLFGVTDGKAVGTYLEHKFRAHLQTKFDFIIGSSASGIDFPELEVDMKVTSIKQPQSSCPFKSARQKIHGLGYSLLVFVYDKTDDEKKRKARLNILHTIFVTKERTADFQTTTGIRRILENAGNKDDLLAFFEERFLLPVAAVEANELAKELLVRPPEIGYLASSRPVHLPRPYLGVIEYAGAVTGVLRLR